MDIRKTLVSIKKKTTTIQRFRAHSILMYMIVSRAALLSKSIPYNFLSPDATCYNIGITQETILYPTNAQSPVNKLCSSSWHITLLHEIFATR